MRASTRGLAPANVGSEPASIYLAALSNGYVKIGTTRNASRRIPNLQDEAKKKYGATLVDVCYFPDCGGFFTEEHCIRALRAVGEPLLWTREYFDGIAFDEAKRLVEEVVVRYRSDADSVIDWSSQDLLTSVVAALKRMTPSELARAAVACEASSVTLKNIRNGKTGSQGPGYHLVENLHRYLRKKSETK